MNRHLPVPPIIMSLLFLILVSLAACSEKQIFGESTCSIDVVNDSTAPTVNMKRTDILRVGGWAFDNLSKQSPDSISINLVSSTGVITKFADGKTIVARPDVSAVFSAPSVPTSGFNIDAKLEVQQPGAYELQILEYFSNRILVCRTSRSIRLE